jgi:hypothetical protein
LEKIIKPSPSHRLLAPKPERTSSNFGGNWIFIAQRTAADYQPVRRLRLELQMGHFAYSHSETTDPITSHFEGLLADRARGVLDAVCAARSAIRKCRQERIETYLLRKEIHLKVCQLTKEVAKARLLTLAKPWAALNTVRQPES